MVRLERGDIEEPESRSGLLKYDLASVNHR